MSTDDYADLARHAEAIPPEARDWTYQSWGEQNQNGDHADSILYDGRGETIVYELPNDVGEFIAAANPATILRLIEDNRRLRSDLDAEVDGRKRADVWREKANELAANVAAVEAEHEALADSLRVEAAQIVSRVSDEPMRQPTPVDELLGIDPNDTAMRSAARAVQAQRQLTLLARRLAAVEALATEWEHTDRYLRRIGPGSITYQDAVSHLRAVLSAAPTDTTKETDR